MPCDVIEGACTVDCGSAWRIVCDTGEWFNDDDNGGLDVVVTIEEVGPSICRISGQRGVSQSSGGVEVTRNRREIIAKSGGRRRATVEIFVRPSIIVRDSIIDARSL
jgi:hypothetical protein